VHECKKESDSVTEEDKPQQKHPHTIREVLSLFLYFLKGKLLKIKV